MKELIAEIKNCVICLPHLINGVNPVLSVHPKSKVAIIGQAPGSLVHKTGVPWDDSRGESLREWLGVNNSDFYNAEQFALIPVSIFILGTVIGYA